MSVCVFNNFFVMCLCSICAVKKFYDDYCLCSAVIFRLFLEEGVCSAFSFYLVATPKETRLSDTHASILTRFSH